ncbi:hypothetical protein Acid7E03_39850 [Acidisoma sp. 7E03]
MNSTKKRLCHYIRTSTIEALDAVAFDTGRSRSELLDLAGQLLAAEYGRQLSEAINAERPSFLHRDILQRARAEHTALLERASEQFDIVRGQRPSETPRAKPDQKPGFPAYARVAEPRVPCGPVNGSALRAGGVYQCPAGSGPSGHRK